MPFRTILVGTDGSATARIAEGIGARLAGAFGGRLVIVSAYEGDAEARVGAERTVVEAARELAEGGRLETATEVAEGDPAAVVVELADRVDADLIVVGDIGMGQPRRLRLGGVPDRVSHAAPCSLLIVRTSKLAAEANARGKEAGAYRSVLIATDGSPTASRAAHVGGELAGALGARITLVHVGDELVGKVVLKDTAERLGDPELPARIAGGDPGPTIVELAESESHDLVVVGSKGMAGPARVLGSVPNTVSHAAACDVLIVQTVGRSLSDLEPGEGAIVEEDGRKIAGYRDESGEAIALSRKCKHLGCSVGWNPSLRTWDCPCHGSRYDARGKVIRGPAQADLDPIEV
jgi:nucleotide-binding universal stress UspA family protein/nitrite reductase/ring-hydroxylating ferredoxin subunit